MALRSCSTSLRKSLLFPIPQVLTLAKVQESWADAFLQPQFDACDITRQAEAAHSCPVHGLGGRKRWFRSSPSLQKSIEVEIQSMGESISEGTIAEILKEEGDSVEEDETIAQIETDKVTIDLRAPAAGQLSELRVSVEDTVKVGQIVAIVSEGAEGHREKSGSTKPAESQDHEKHDPFKDSHAKSHKGNEEPSKRQPSIHFPRRMVDGKRISDLSESDRPRQDDKAAGPPPEKPQEKKADASKSPQPKKSQPWYVGKEQGTKLSQSRVLTQKEMEQIELGGAEP